MSETNLTTTIASVARQTPLTDAEIARMVAVLTAFGGGPSSPYLGTEDDGLIALGLLEFAVASTDRVIATYFATECCSDQDDLSTFRVPQFGDFYPCEPEVEAELTRRGGDPIPAIVFPAYLNPTAPNAKFLLRRDGGVTSVLIGHRNSHLSELWANVTPNGDGRFYVECGVTGNRYVSDSAFRYDIKGTIPDVYDTEPEAVVGACRMLCAYNDSLRGDVDDMAEDLKRITEAMSPKVEVAK